MKNTAFSLTIAAMLLASSALSGAQKNGSGKTETSWGMHTASFATARGRVTVNLPDDIAAGDTISGTVIAEPSGNNQRDRRRNTDELNGYVVELDNQKAPVKAGAAKWIVPAGPATQLIL